MMATYAFDYRIIATCEYGVAAVYSPEGVDDCGKPAPYQVWWADDESDFMTVCAEHFEAIRASEEENA